MGKTICQAAGATQVTTANTVEYWKLAGNNNGGSENYEQTIFRSAGVFSNLYARVSANSIAATSSIRFRKNAADGTESVSIGSTATGEFEDASGTDTIAAGDKVNVSTNPGAITGTMSISIFSVIFSATTDTVTKLAIATVTFATASTTTFISLHGADTLDVTEANSKCRMRKAGTLKNMAAYIRLARATASTIRSRKNGANGNLVLSLTAATTGLFEDTSNTDTITAGEDWNYSITTLTGVDTLDIRSLCTEFVSTNNDGICVCANTIALTLADNTNRFFVLAGLATIFSTETGATGCQTKARAAFVMSELTTLVTANDVTSASTLVLRVGAAASALTVSITGSTTGVFSDSTHTVTLATTDDINFQLTVPSVSGTHNVTIRNILVYTTLAALTRVSLTRIYQNKIVGRVSLSRIYKNKIVGRISLSRIYKNRILNRISLSRIYKNKIQGRVSLSRIYKNKIVGRVSLSRIYKNKIVGRVSLSRIYKNKIAVRVSLTRIYKNKIRARVSLSRIYKNKIGARVSLSRIYKNKIAARISLSRIYKNKIQARVSLTRIYINQIIVSGLTRISLTRVYKNKIQARVSLQRQYKNRILNRISLSRIYKNRILTRVSLSRIYKNRILSRVSLSRIYKNRILSRVTLTRIYKNKIGQRISLTRIYKNKIRARISLTRVYKNRILNRVSLSRIYKNRILSRVTLSRIYKNKIRARVSLQRIYKNRILNRISLTRIYKNRILNRVSLTRIYINKISNVLLTRVSLSQIYVNKIQARVSLIRRYLNRIQVKPFRVPKGVEGKGPTNERVYHPDIDIDRVPEPERDIEPSSISESHGRARRRYIDDPDLE